MGMGKVQLKLVFLAGIICIYNHTVIPAKQDIAE
jgi:hypothetical protein